MNKYRKTILFSFLLKDTSSCCYFIIIFQYAELPIWTFQQYLMTTDSQTTLSWKETCLTGCWCHWMTSFFVLWSNRTYRIFLTCVCPSLFCAFSKWSLFYMANINCVWHLSSHSVGNYTDCFYCPSYFPYFKSEFPTMNTVLIWICITDLYKYKITFSILYFHMEPKMFALLLFLEDKKIIEYFWNFQSDLYCTFLMVVLIFT